MSLSRYHRGPVGPRWLSSGALLSWVLTCVCPVSARAQLSVDRLELTLQPEGTVFAQGVITVRNRSDAPVQASVHLEDWDRREDGTNRWQKVGSVPGACNDKLDVFPQALSLDPGTSQGLRVTYTGNSALADECWGAVVLAAVRPPAEGAGITHVLRTAVKIYVPPTVRRPALEVTSIELTGSPDSGNGSTGTVHVSFENTGNVHLVSQATLQIRTADNELAHEVELPASYLLAGASGRVRVPLPDLEPGRYVLLAIADYGGPELIAAQMEHEVR